jgi:hypothetical protein
MASSDRKPGKTIKMTNIVSNTRQFLTGRPITTSHDSQIPRSPRHCEKRCIP